MKKIVVFGAGKSSSYAIKYLTEVCSAHNWQLIVCDRNTEHIKSKFVSGQSVVCTDIDITDSSIRRLLIAEASLVVSLMPPQLHILIAEDCVAEGTHLITASYVSKEMKALHTKAIASGCMLMCELGLDPGIDHMSAMHIIDDLHRQGAVIKSFYSHCGGLVAPGSDDNIWRYKISWNPRNVITAGAAGADYMELGTMRHVPYEQIFSKAPLVQVTGLEEPLAYYPNRDSVGYKDDYKLSSVETLVRTTLRYPTYIQAWSVLVKYGCTSTTDEVSNCSTYADWFSAKLQGKRWQDLVADTTIREMLDALRLDRSEPLAQSATCSADVLQAVIEQQWEMGPDDKDMIVMQHDFEYELHGKLYSRKSSLVVEGEDKVYTAMAKTVGLPMAIFAELILTEQVTPDYGVLIPVDAKVYQPLLQRLANNDIKFVEHVQQL
jgi:saccharopine dehydrogenase-like NADP-dependent oxidoreductase